MEVLGVSEPRTGAKRLPVKETSENSDLATFKIRNGLDDRPKAEDPFPHVFSSLLEHEPLPERGHAIRLREDRRPYPRELDVHAFPKQLVEASSKTQDYARHNSR